MCACNGTGMLAWYMVYGKLCRLQACEGRGQVGARAAWGRPHLGGPTPVFGGLIDPDQAQYLHTYIPNLVLQLFDLHIHSCFTVPLPSRRGIVPSRDVSFKASGRGCWGCFYCSKSRRRSEEALGSGEHCRESIASRREGYR